MEPVRKAYDLDLSKMGDEELVVLAQECGYHPAANALIVRYHEWANRLIAFKARRTRLTAADVQDAQQNAVFAIREAITRYNTTEFVKPKGCSFRTFLRVVLTSRFQDFVKNFGRRESHYDRQRPDSADILEAGVSEGEQLALARGPLHGCLNDPAAAAEWHEALTRLDEALNRLDASARQIWELLARGTRLRTLAKELGVSYDSAKRRRQKLLAELKAQLKERG